MNAHYHLSGIAGVGMSALAEALLDSGAEVSGSDRLVDSGRETPTVASPARLALAAEQAEEQMPALVQDDLEIYQQIHGQKQRRKANEQA